MSASPASSPPAAPVRRIPDFRLRLLGGLLLLASTGLVSCQLLLW